MPWHRRRETRTITKIMCTIIFIVLFITSASFSRRFSSLTGILRKIDSRIGTIEYIKSRLSILIGLQFVFINSHTEFTPGITNQIINKQVWILILINVSFISEYNYLFNAFFTQIHIHKLPRKNDSFRIEWHLKKF